MPGTISNRTTTLPAADLVGSLAAADATPSSSPGIDWLICDLTGITAHSIAKQDVIDVVAMSHGSKQVNARLLVHIVATDNDLIDLLQLANDPELNNPYRSNTFSTVESARRFVSDSAG